MVDYVTLGHDAAKLADDVPVRRFGLQRIFAIAIRAPLLIELNLECRLLLLFLFFFLVIWFFLNKAGHDVLFGLLLGLLLPEPLELLVLLLLGFVDAGQ